MPIMGKKVRKPGLHMAGQAQQIKSSDSLTNLRTRLQSVLDERKKARKPAKKGSSPDKPYPGEYCYVEDVTPTHVVYREGSKVYAAPYTATATSVKIGEPYLVEQVWQRVSRLS